MTKKLMTLLLAAWAFAKVIEACGDLIAHLKRRRKK
ncbi:hypothetical protein B0G77_2462 [Paraburkholderia sp. BL10I2N1]|nr:hypothetical protein B0G77_2462 [Paraburkholderia sp. BL10I2N1]